MTTTTTEEQTGICTGCEDQGTDMCKEAYECAVCGKTRNACAFWPGWPENIAEVCASCEETALGIPHKGAVSGKGGPWRKSEISRMEELIKSGVEIEQIAAELGRTRKSIEAKARITGAKTVWSHVTWTESDAATMAKMLRAGACAEDIGRAVGRSAKAVKQRAYRIGLSVDLASRL